MVGGVGGGGGGGGGETKLGRPKKKGLDGETAERGEGERKKKKKKRDVGGGGDDASTVRSG
jgi:transcription initiation factor TFIID subunit 13